MKTKKSLSVIAVTAAVLMLAAVLFVGAGAAADPQGYWQEQVYSDVPDGYEISEDKTTVTISKPEGLAYFAQQLVADSSAYQSPLTVKFNGTIDMGAHYWVPLSTNKWTIDETNGKATQGAAIAAMSGATFKSVTEEIPATIKNLHVKDTLEFPDSPSYGANNNYGSGFIGNIQSGSGVTFKDLIFSDVTVCPVGTHKLTHEGEHGFNFVAAIVGEAQKPVEFNNVTVMNSTITGTSKVGAFVGMAQSSGTVKFTNCSVVGTTINGLDSAAGLVGYASQTVTIDPDTTVAATINTAITPSLVEKEYLGVICTDGTQAPLWTIEGGELTTMLSLPAGKTVAYVVKGNFSNFDTDPTLRAAKADLYNKELKAGKLNVKLYGKEGDLTYQTYPVNKYEAAIGSTNYAKLEDAIAAVNEGGIINLLTDIARTAQLTIGKAGKFTIDGQGHKITVIHSDSTESNGAAILISATNAGVTLKNITVVGPSDTPINTWSEHKEVIKVFGGYNTFENVNVQNGVESILVSGENTTLVLKGDKNHFEGSAYNGIEVADNCTLTLDPAVKVTITPSTDDTNKEHAYIWFDAAAIDGTKVTGPAVQVTHPKKEQVYWVIGGSVVAEIEGETPKKFATLADAFAAKGVTADGEVKLVTDCTVVTQITATNTSKLNLNEMTITAPADDETFKIFASMVTITGHGWINVAKLNDPLDTGLIWNSVSKEVSEGETKVVTSETVSVNKDIAPASEGKPAVKLEKVENLPNTVTGVTVATTSQKPTNVKEVFAVVDITLSDNTGVVSSLTDPAKISFVVYVDSPSAAEKFVVYHGKYETSGEITWTQVSAEKLVGEQDQETLKYPVTITVASKSFSPFAVVELNPPAPSSSSSRDQGSSVWLKDETVQPTPVQTAEPTPVETTPAAPVASPVSSPVEPAQPTSTPAPFLGILAGLGAAAVFFGLRRK